MTTQQPSSAAFTASAPSNIAFVKYWGKRDAELQWPANDSLSMTLSNCKTTTTARKSPQGFDSFSFKNLTITSDQHPDHKVFRHISRIKSKLNRNDHLSITSDNSFPSDCGIASSASGFCALTLSCAAALLDTDNWDDLAAYGSTRAQLSHMARLGSGSACRSIYGGYVKWAAGDSASEQRVQQSWSHEHWALADIIVVLSSAPKAVSSSVAHQAAWASPLFQPRLAGIPSRMQIITNAIHNKDLESLGREIENEALEMHAICMTGAPVINYFSEKTSAFLSWLRAERTCGRLPAWATVDAGPNVHLICRQLDAEDVIRFVKKNWPDVQLIKDQVGSGPTITRAPRGGLDV